MVSTQRGPFAIDLDKFYSIKLGGHPTLKGRAAFWLFDPDFQAVASFRFGQAAREYYARNKLLGLLPFMISILWRRRMSNIHQVYIHRQARIGPGLLIMHRNGLLIGPVSIGDNCVLHHNVTGGRVAEGDRSLPRLGDNVWVAQEQ